MVADRYLLAARAHSDLGRDVRAHDRWCQLPGCVSQPHRPRCQLHLACRIRPWMTWTAPVGDRPSVLVVVSGLPCVGTTAVLWELARQLSGVQVLRPASCLRRPEDCTERRRCLEGRKRAHAEDGGRYGTRGRRIIGLRGVAPRKLHACLKLTARSTESNPSWSLLSQSTVGTDADHTP